MLATASAALVLAVAAVAGTSPADEPRVVGEGDILVGSATTRFWRSLTVAAGVEGVESFRFHLPPGVTQVSTRTTDGAGLGYNLDLWFHNALGVFQGGCATGPIASPGQRLEESCAVPADATKGTVDAVWGARLHVQVLGE